MSPLYNYLTRDPDYIPGEPRGRFFRRVNRRRAIQRLLIRSFPREFQALDESLFNKAMHKAGGEKNSIVSGAIETFTGSGSISNVSIDPGTYAAVAFNRPIARHAQLHEAP